MRSMLGSALMAAAMTAGCDLGVVDLRRDPGPAEIVVVSEMEGDPEDPSRVEIVMRAVLQTGIGPDGTPRSMVSDALVVEGTPHLPTAGHDPSTLTWSVPLGFAAPGPEGVRLSLPRPEGLGPGESLTMRVRVATTPEGTVFVGEGQDLVVHAEPPSFPAETVEWSMDLSSGTMPDFRLRLGGTGAWPEEIRVPVEQVPAEALPVRAEAYIAWDRRLTLIELTPQDRYDLALRSIMRLGWTFEPAS